MTLNHLLAGLDTEPNIQNLLDSIQGEHPHASVVDLPTSLRPALVALISGHLERPILVVTSRADRADLLAAAINEFLPGEREAILWNGPEALPARSRGWPLAHRAETR